MSFVRERYSRRCDVIARIAGNTYRPLDKVRRYEHRPLQLQHIHDIPHKFIQTHKFTYSHIRSLTPQCMHFFLSVQEQRVHAINTFEKPPTTTMKLISLYSQCRFSDTFELNANKFDPENRRMLRLQIATHARRFPGRWVCLCGCVCVCLCAVRSRGARNDVESPKTESPKAATNVLRGRLSNGK